MGATKQKSQSINQRVVFILLVIVLSLQSLLTVVGQWETFFSPGYDGTYAQLEVAYNSSQYHKKKNQVSMSDADFEQFAGGIFLKGLNPVLIVHDHPPLGRYFISLSIFLFDNPHFIMLPFMVFSALAVYLLGYQTLKHQFLALIPFGIFINEPLFIQRLIMTPLPEPLQLPFILFAIYFFLRGVDDKKDLRWFMLTSLMLGFVISTRFFVLGAALTGSMGLYLLMTQLLGMKTWRFVFTLPIAGLVLLASYFRTFQSGYSLIQVVSIQKYILAYHQSKFILPFTVWDLLLFNRWHTWWGNRAILADAQWIIFWPLAVFLSAVSFGLGIKERFATFSTGEKFLFLWILIDLAMLSTGYTTSRYFLPLVPLLYILATSGVIRAIGVFVPKSQLKKLIPTS